MSQSREHLDALEERLEAIGDLAVAASGGVDSMTLAVVAHRLSALRVEIFHAVSPAVPPEATARVRRYAGREGWTLRVLDAREFHDEDYLRNPVNRCFYCKSNLYRAIGMKTSAQLVSGTNTDDLGDYRPGLDAASDHDVRHPFVEAGIDKRTIRGIARSIALDDVADLPASPCLASRIETGIPIQPHMLTVVHLVEREVSRRLQPEAVRCRVRAGRVVIELDQHTLNRLSPADRQRAENAVAALCRDRGFDRPVEIDAYRMGSAFLGKPT